MRLSFALFLLSVADVATAFLNVRPPTTSCILKSGSSSPSLLMSSEPKEKEADDYDDWYADFDPSTADAINTKHSNESPSRSPSSGNRKPQGNADHDYSRDTMADSSDVDLNRVNSLMSERLQCRKTGQFDQADSLRDELLETHGVMVRDKERTWRSGCSKSSSEGNRWMRDNKSGRDNNTRGRNQPKDFGPNGHDYQLARDAGPNNSQLSVNQINQLLKERLEFKFNRDFKSADAIQRKFLDAGVLVNDREKEWRADGKSFEGHGARSIAYAGTFPAPANMDEIQALVDQRSRAKAERLYKEADKLRDELADKFDIFIDDRQAQWTVGRNDNFNPKRRELFSPFAMSETSERPEDHDEIQQLVERRDSARADRNYDAADGIRNQLLDRDIHIDDKRRQWGVGAFEDEIPRRSLNRNDAFAIAKRSERPEDHDEIQQLVERRDSARADRDYDTADGIRNQLLDRNIYVDDKGKQWAVGDGCFEDDAPPRRSRNEAFAMSETSERPEDHDEVQQLVERRDAFRAGRDFDSADDIRNQLMDRNIFIDDKRRQWTVGDGGFGDDSQSRSGGRESSDYFRRGGGSISKENEAAVVSMLRAREAHKRNRRYQSADDIRDKLRDDFSVRVDDRSKEWHVVTDEYIKAGNSAPLDAETQIYVEQQIAKRAMAKLQKDYETADAIRSELMQEYLVSIDDRVREWVKLDGQDDGNNYSGDSTTSSIMSEDEEVESDEDAHEDAEEAPVVVAEAPMEEAAEDLEKLTIPELKDRLRAAELPVGGKKSELIERLTATAASS